MGSMSLLQDAQQHDGQLEEGGEGDADDDGAVWIGAGRDETGEHPQAEEDVHALLAQDAAAEDSHHAHEGDHQRQLEDDAEGQQEEGDEAEVAARIEQQDEILAAEADQPFDGVAQHEEADCDAEGEQPHAEQRERQRILALAPCQRRRDEGPHLIEHDGHGNGEPDSERELQRDDKRLADVLLHELLLRIHANEMRGDGRQRREQQPQHWLPEEEGDDGADDDGDGRDHQALAQLFQVLDERHRAAHRPIVLRLRAFRRGRGRLIHLGVAGHVACRHSASPPDAPRAAGSLVPHATRHQTHQQLRTPQRHARRLSHSGAAKYIPKLLGSYSALTSETMGLGADALVVAAGALAAGSCCAWLAGRAGGGVTSGSGSLTSRMDFWNSLIVLPTEEPSSGSRFGPKNSMPSAITISSSGQCNPRGIVNALFPCAARPRGWLSRVSPHYSPRPPRMLQTAGPWAYSMVYTRPRGIRCARLRYCSAYGVPVAEPSPRLAASRRRL